MAMMVNTWYLPSETLHYRNYPEVNLVRSDIDTLITYAMRIENALDYYNSGILNKIDIDIIDLQKNIELCRKVNSILGSASNVCYDILMELRELQNVMQSLLYVRNRFGNQYIGTPSETSEATG